MHDRYASILFLSTLAGLTACPDDDDGDGNGDTTATGTSSGSSGVGAGTVVATTSVSTTGAQTSETATSADTSTTSSTTDADSTDTGADMTTTAGDTGARDCGPFPAKVGPISEGCVDYVALLEMCLAEQPLSPACVAYEQAVCQYMVDFDTMNAGPECAAAYDELYACFSTLSCREFGSGTGCMTRATSWQAACFG